MEPDKLLCTRLYYDQRDRNSTLARLNESHADRKPLKAAHTRLMGGMNLALLRLKSKGGGGGDHARAQVRPQTGRVPARAAPGRPVARPRRAPV